MREAPQTIHRRDVIAGGTAAGLALMSSRRGAQAAAVPPAKDAPPFATDIRLPGLLHAVVARPPIYGARLASLDASQALRLNGVADVIALTPCSGAALSRLGGVAVLARDTWTALRGCGVLRLAWSDVPDDASDRPPEAGDHFIPDTAEPLMEPPSATVRAGADSCAAWACLREPERARAALAARLGLPIPAIALHAAASACGPGRFSSPAYLFDAARLSRAMRGAPVSLVWTRADDMPFRARSPMA